MFDLIRNSQVILEFAGESIFAKTDGFGEDTSGRVFLTAIPVSSGVSGLLHHVDIELWDDGVVEFIFPDDSCVRGTWRPA